MNKAVLRMIGVASLLGSAACLPSFDQPAAQNTVENPATPATSPTQATGDNGVVSPLTPSQQTAIWMQGGDPSLLADRAYDEGPIGIASQKHSCAKMKFNTIGRLLAGRGVAITAGDNPATLPVTATTTCPAPCWLNPLPQGNNLRSLWREPSGDGWAVGFGPSVVRLEGGRARLARTPVRENKYIFNGVWGSAPNDYWAVGGLGTILH